MHRLCFRGVTPALLETIAEKVAEKVQHSTHGNLFSLSDSRYRWTPLHLLAGYSVNLESIKIVCRECPESLGLTETRLGKTPFEVAQIYEPQRANHAEVLSLLDALTRAFHSGGAKEVWGITGLPLVRRRAVELRWTVLACMTYGRRENATDEAWANMHGFFRGVAGRDMYSEILSFI
ncbi:hypothetical protein TeGR_g7354 [Tetraparma gracilis]|uniref:Uncharacterized protein n=1 Tax=Tetraparma gracilis TaxID=2962635 RepID=A0ABQ6N5Z7_9STRA|nr:hypothetical protein TeGR_g7354 [Tetraparma gracilis]